MLEIYLITTEGCNSCSIARRQIKKVKETETFEFKEYDFKECPEFITNSIILKDFPLIIFVKDNVIKFFVEGTINSTNIIKIINEIK